MEISREFILAEMEQVQSELHKARVFVIQAETSLSIYNMLLSRLAALEGEDGSNLPETS